MTTLGINSWLTRSTIACLLNLNAVFVCTAAVLAHRKTCVACADICKIVVTKSGIRRIATVAQRAKPPFPNFVGNYHCDSGFHERKPLRRQLHSRSKRVWVVTLRFHIEARTVYSSANSVS